MINARKAWETKETRTHLWISVEMARLHGWQLRINRPTIPKGIGRKSDPRETIR